MTRFMCFTKPDGKVELPYLPRDYWSRYILVEQSCIPARHNNTCTGSESEFHSIGLHRGKYEALVQVKPVTLSGTMTETQSLISTMEIKRPEISVSIFTEPKAQDQQNSSISISAGCQVFKDADDFYAFMQLCKASREASWNQFSYTLIDFRSLRRILPQASNNRYNHLLTSLWGELFKPNINR